MRRIWTVVPFLLGLCLPVAAQVVSFKNSAGPGQYALAVTTGTTILTVPNGAVCAYITIETANVRRTSDGSTPTTSSGTLLTSGTQWSDCGPLTSYKFSAVSGSPTLDVEYFK